MPPNCRYLEISQMFYLHYITITTPMLLQITGVGDKLENELAMRYASKGATVVLWNNSTKNDKILQEISGLGYPKAYEYQLVLMHTHENTILTKTRCSCDVSNRDHIWKIAKDVQQEVGNVTILVNNASVMHKAKFDEHEQGTVDYVFQLNTMAHFLVKFYFCTLSLNLKFLNSCFCLYRQSKPFWNK